MFKKFHISHKFFAILTNIATKEQKNKNFGCANELYRNKIGCDIVTALCAATISQPILLRYIDNSTTCGQGVVYISSEINETDVRI